MKYVIIFLSVINFFYASASQPSIHLQITVPKGTPANAQLSLGGAFNGWDPSQGNYQFTREDDGTWQGVLPEFDAGKVLIFKVTRGNWETVEVNADGSDIGDRRYKVKPGLQQIKINVAAWSDQVEKKTIKSSAVKDIIVEKFELPTFSGKRNVYIFLPDDYLETNKRYPVIYMTDGRNLFDVTVGAANEWGMDELMMKFAKQDSPLSSIVVGIDHAGANRKAEYSPWNYHSNTNEEVQAKGVDFSAWLVNTLKPSIDSRYRTKPERDNTTMLGSSMGGLISCYTALKYQEIFSKVGCYSPAFLKSLVQDNLLNFIKSTGRKQPMKIHTDMGDAELDLFGEQIMAEMREVSNALLESGFNQQEVRFQIIKDGIHEEQDWRLRTENILLWLNANHR